MITRSIQHPDFMQIRDDDTGKIFYGCDQEWYHSKLQRLAGCGPTTAATILSYLKKPKKATVFDPPLKSTCLAEMEEVWKSVTPGPRGIPSTAMLRAGLLKLAQAKGVCFDIRRLDIPAKREKRPPFSAALDFLADALKKDLPVAFLNLHNGDVAGLDAWHWVTIISISFEPDGSIAEIKILDEGLCKAVDFALWFRTTRLGGGLLTFDLA